MRHQDSAVHAMCEMDIVNITHDLGAWQYLDMQCLGSPLVSNIMTVVIGHGCCQDGHQEAMPCGSKSRPAGRDAREGRRGKVLLEGD